MFPLRFITWLDKVKGYTHTQRWEKMELEIVSIDNGANGDDECVAMMALKDCELGDYMICDSTYFEDHSISNMSRHTYFFVPWKVKAGHHVVLWTGSDGVDDKPKTIEHDGAVIHHFFWGLNEQIWNNDGDCALLVKISDMQDFPVLGN